MTEAVHHHTSGGHIGWGRTDATLRRRFRLDLDRSLVQVHVAGWYVGFYR